MNGNSDAVQNPTPAGAVASGYAPGAQPAAQPQVSQTGQAVIPSGYVQTPGMNNTVSTAIPPTVQHFYMAQAPAAAPVQASPAGTLSVGGLEIGTGSLLGNQNPSLPTGPVTPAGTQGEAPSAHATRTQSSDTQSQSPEGEPQKKKDPIEKKEGKLLIAQARFDAEISEAKERGRKQAQAEFDSAEQQLREESERQAALQRGEIEKLYGESRQEIAQLRLQIQDLTQRLSLAQGEVLNYSSLFDESIDNKIAVWPEDLREFDPKQAAPSSYTIKDRLQFVERFQKIVDRLSGSGASSSDLAGTTATAGSPNGQAYGGQYVPSAAPAVPGVPGAPPVMGINGAGGIPAPQAAPGGLRRDPSPAGASDADLQRIHAEQKAAFRREHPFSL